MASARAHVMVGMLYIAAVMILSQGWAGNIANGVRRFAGVPEKG